MDQNTSNPSPKEKILELSKSASMFNAKDLSIISPNASEIFSEVHFDFDVYFKLVSPSLLKIMKEAGDL